MTNSRSSTRQVQTWRRRACTNCGSLLTSLEKPVWAGSLAVISLNSTISAFNRDKLLLSLHESLKHRPGALEEAIGLTETVITLLLKRASRAALHTRLIRQTAAETLRRFDNAAFVHYEAYHTDK